MLLSHGWTSCDLFNHGSWAPLSLRRPARASARASASTATACSASPRVGWCGGDGGEATVYSPPLTKSLSPPCGAALGVPTREADLQPDIQKMGLWLSQLGTKPPPEALPLRTLLSARPPPVLLLRVTGPNDCCCVICPGANDTEDHRLLGCVSSAAVRNEKDSQPLTGCTTALLHLELPMGMNTLAGRWWRRCMQPRTQHRTSTAPEAPLAMHTVRYRLSWEANVASGVLASGVYAAPGAGVGGGGHGAACCGGAAISVVVTGGDTSATPVTASNPAALRLDAVTPPPVAVMRAATAAAVAQEEQSTVYVTSIPLDAACIKARRPPLASVVTEEMATAVVVTFNEAATIATNAALAWAVNAAVEQPDRRTPAVTTNCELGGGVCPSGAGGGAGGGQI